MNKLSPIAFDKFGAPIEHKDIIINLNDGIHTHLFGVLDEAPCNTFIEAVSLYDNTKKAYLRPQWVMVVTSQLEANKKHE